MTATATRYAAFAAEARGCAPYSELAQAVAGDAALIAWLGTLPVARRQPNLLFACMRLLTGAVPTIDTLRRVVTSDGDRLRAEMMRRSTQTNEAARCAVLLPWLSRLPQPLALLEVGASAGLCLFPDRYDYDHDTHRLDALDGAPVLPCRAGSGIAVPDRLPRVVWRAGLDLNPLDPAEPDDLRWLEGADLARTGRAPRPAASGSGHRHASRADGAAW